MVGENAGNIQGGDHITGKFFYFGLNIYINKLGEQMHANISAAEDHAQVSKERQNKQRGTRRRRGKKKRRPGGMKRRQRGTKRRQRGTKSRRWRTPLKKGEDAWCWRMNFENWERYSMCGETPELERGCPASPPIPIFPRALFVCWFLHICLY